MSENFEFDWFLHDNQIFRVHRKGICFGSKLQVGVISKSIHWLLKKMLISKLLISFKLALN